MPKVGDLYVKCLLLSRSELIPFVQTMYPVHLLQEKGSTFCDCLSAIGFLCMQRAADEKRVIRGSPWCPPLTIPRKCAAMPLPFDESIDITNLALAITVAPQSNITKRPFKTIDRWSILLLYRGGRRNGVCT